MKYKVAKTKYFKAFSDKNMIQFIINIVGDIYNKKYPDDSPMGMYTVGELAKIKGFHASMAMVDELIGAMAGRAIRGFCIQFGISPLDDIVFNLMNDTSFQQERIRNKVLEELIKKYGTPGYIDEEKIADITSRAARFLGMPTH